MSKGARTANEEMIAGYDEPRTLRLARTILIASPPRAGRIPLSPEPTRNAPTTPRSPTASPGYAARSALAQACARHSCSPSERPRAAAEIGEVDPRAKFSTKLPIGAQTRSI